MSTPRTGRSGCPRSKGWIIKELRAPGLPEARFFVNRSRSPYFSHTRATAGVGFFQQSSKSPQQSLICNHTLARGDLLDSSQEGFRVPNSFLLSISNAC